jgi:hypothetical protein
LSFNVKTNLLFGATALAGGVLYAVAGSRLQLLLAFAAAVVLSVGLYLLFAWQEDTRIRTRVAMVSEPQALSVAQQVASDRGWLTGGHVDTRLRFGDHSKSARPVWEIEWQTPWYTTGRVWIDVVTGEITEVWEMPPR